MRRTVSMSINEKFMEIITFSGEGGRIDDPAAEEIYLDLLSDIKTVGEGMLKALSKSRGLPVSEEDLQAYLEERVSRQWIYEKYPEVRLFSLKASYERYKLRIEKAIKMYGYKRKRDFWANMQVVSVEDEDGKMAFFLFNHAKLKAWDGGNNVRSLNFSIPSNSSEEVIGAAVRYAIGCCRGLGADYLRGLLFPEGQPETLEEYLKQLNLSLPTE